MFERFGLSFPEVSFFCFDFVFVSFGVNFPAHAFAFVCRRSRQANLRGKKNERAGKPGAGKHTASFASGYLPGTPLASLRQLN